jgi:tetrahydromethanopterin S-methyltransferase subunit E
MTAPVGTVRNGRLYNESPSAMPNAKVLNGAVAGAVTVLAVWLLETFAHVAMPATVSAALTVIFTFAMGYVTPPAGFNGPDPNVGDPVVPPDVPAHRPPTEPTPPRGGW